MIYGLKSVDNFGRVKIGIRNTTLPIYTADCFYIAVSVLLDRPKKTTSIGGFLGPKWYLSLKTVADFAQELYFF